MKRTYEEWEAMTLTELAAEMKSVKTQLDFSKAETESLQKDWDSLRKSIIPNKMEELGIESVRVAGVGTLSRRFDAYCNVVPGAQEELYEWLESEGKGDVIKPTVNSSTLKALMKEMFNEGEEIPEAFVKFNPYTYVVITK